MPRKKSRPTHRENAAAVPSNEGGFYKMFWNSMDTGSGTGPNSPSQHATSPPVIIIDGSPADSPCAHDENSCDVAVPQPIKEEFHVEPVENVNQPSAVSHSDLQESHSEINGDCSLDRSTCLPEVTSRSKNSSPSPSACSLISLEAPLETANGENFNFSLINSEVCVPPQVVHCTTENSDQLADAQVRDQLTKEQDDMSSDRSPSPVDASITPSADQIPHHSVNMAVSHMILAASTPPCGADIADDIDIPAIVGSSPELPSDQPEEASVVIPMDVGPELHSDSQIMYDENVQDPPENGSLDPQYSTLNEENLEISSPPSPALSDSVGRTLNLLQSLLNAPDEDLEDFNEAFAELPALIGQHQFTSEQNVQEDAAEFESAEETSFHSNVDNNAETYQGHVETERMVCSDESGDGALQNNPSPMVVDDKEEETFPKAFSSFLPKRIKVDSVGILRSVKLLKDSVRALYKEYLKDDVILRTVTAPPEPPAQESSESSDEVQETQTLTPDDVFPIPICCVKMERLPNPIVEKNTVTMSDQTLKTWKRRIIQNRNEEKFRHLKVWRRGRTLLWRECELAGMDRATYDEQVAYIKKHKLNENSSSDDDSSGDESGDDACSHLHDSSDDSSSDGEHSDRDDEASVTSYETSPESEHPKPNENPILPTAETVTSVKNIPENEYTVVETALPHQNSTAETPSALKITIRKTSMSKEKEDDQDTPADKEENFPAPTIPIKTRKIATKRTFRRPSDPVPKASVPSKSTAVDTKKSKTAVDNEDLYDQSLLGRRSYEVENFNLLEKWEIPFEEPTLFRSPRAASRLAQLKTKEAFAPTLKRHAPPKTPNSTAPGASGSVGAVTVTKEVREVVQWLCSRTVEAMLFPGSQPPGNEKHAETSETSINESDANTHKQPTEVPCKSSFYTGETSLTLDECSEMSQSETNSTLGSDFGGSTASLASEDFIPPKDKSPQKPRRRRRVSIWHKKKKGKGKAAEFQPESENRLSSHHTDWAAAEESFPGTKTADEICNSPAHQVPVVSEGPGQSPHESEDDSSHRAKHPVQQAQTEETGNVKSQPADESSGLLLEKLQPPKEVKEVVQPRLTRSKQPTVKLDPDFIENFGVRKRKPKLSMVDEISQDEDVKKPKPDATKKDQQQLSSSNDSKILERVGSRSEHINDNLNTQVPEVSEGPGEVGLDHDKEDGTARMLRSRSRGPRATKGKDSSSQRSDVKIVEQEMADKSHAYDPVVLESPQSPPPEPTVPEPLMEGRITRSQKRRSGPAYVTVKSTDASTLPSVPDVVDSIASHLPLKTLLRVSSPEARPRSEAVQVCSLQTSLASGTNFIPASILGENLKAVQKPHGIVPSVPTLDGTSQNNTPQQQFGVASNSSTEPQAKSAVAAESSGEKLKDGDTTCSKGEIIQPTVLCRGTAAVLNEVTDLKSSTDSRAGISLNESSGKLEVLSTLNNILAVNSPSKVHPVNTAGSSIPPALSSGSFPMAPSTNVSTQSSASTLLPTSTLSSTSLPTFTPSSQDISSILPGTFLSSLLNSTLDASLTTYNNAITDATSLTDDPDGDLVIDEGEAPESDARIDVNFWENLTNADLSDTNGDFSDDDNNTDLTDKINKIIKDQIHQDPVPVPSVKPKETSPGSNDGNKQASEETSSINELDKGAPTLNRRDSIDERTGLPNNLIQRLRDPRIRSRLLSHLEEVETNEKAPLPPSLAPLLGLTGNTATQGNTADQATNLANGDARKKDSVAAQVVCPPTAVDSSGCSQSPAIPSTVTQPVVTELPGLATPFVAPTNPSVVLSGTQLLLVPQGVPSIQPENSDKPEEPPDPSQVDFLVPPSDDEDEEESIKRRPKKARKEVDVELMYKSPLEDLQSESRPGYGERVPRRFADKYPRRKSGEDRPRWDDRRSRIDGPREKGFEERGRSRSRDQRFEDRGRSKSRERFEDRGRSSSRSRFDDRSRDRSRSRDGRAYYDHPPRSLSRDRRAYDPYPGVENGILPQHLDMQVPYPQSPWSAGDPAIHHHQPVMRQPIESPRWQPNYYKEPFAPPHPPIFMPEPPKIDFMETRLVNLELLPKTTNLQVSPIKKVYSYFDKESLQLFEIPKPQYDPKDQPRTIKMMDPVSEEMIDFIQTPRPTSGLTKKYFAHVPPNLSLEDVVKFHCISPAYVMVRDNDEEQSSSSDEEKDELEAKQKKIMHNRKSALEYKKRLSKPALEPHEKPEKRVDSVLEQSGSYVQSQVQERGFLSEIASGSEALQNLLRSFPLLKQQYSQQAMIPPPPPEWNDVDLRMSQEPTKGEDLIQSSHSPSPSRERLSRAILEERTRTPSPFISRTSRSPGRRPRSRSRSHSPGSDMSISPIKSPSYRNRNTRRQRSRSRSSERPRFRRSRSPRRSTSISPSRKHSRH